MDLKQLIRSNLVAVDVEVKDWQDAIRAAARLLINDGVVEERFSDAMIRVAKEFGPYIVVAPGIALPHARPEDGVIKASIAVLRLKTPVEFGNKDNDPVYLVVALAAIDNKQHIEGLSELANVLGDEEKIKNIKQAKTKEKLLEIFLV
ncbi:MAG: PTS sugar transporter subunit IIA [Anaerolineaceae bacterium]|nr:PTS sugar transporter subunit IIA [Anaerolineaceae bacterium]